MLKDSFFQDFVSPLDSAQQKKLLNHRLNCAVMALSVKTKPMDGLPIDPLHKDQVFAEIDEELQSFVPAGQKVNSKARFERLNSLYGEVVE